MTPASARPRATYVVFLVPAVILGVLVAAQWQTQARRTPLASRYQLQLAEAASTLQDEQTGLKAEVVRLRAELDAITAQSADVGGRSAAVKADLDRLRAYSGLSPISGAGVTVTLDDGRVPASAPARTIELAIVHSSDITDVFNTAWKGGAEAIAVNGERITGSSACVGAVIQINGTLLSPPFVVRIVGPPDRLLAAFNDPAALADQKKRHDAFGLRLEVARSASLDLPAYSGPLTVRFATAR